MQVPYEYLRSQTLASKFAHSTLTQRQILLPHSGEVARSADRGSYVILSASEISHDQSEENMPVSSSVGFFTIVQNDVKEKVRLIERKRNIQGGNYCERII